MTTIVCDGRTVASDTQGTVGDERCLGNFAKIVHEQSLIFGICGVTAAMAPMMEWYLKHGAAPDMMPQFRDKFTGTFVVFMPNEALSYNLHSPYPDVDPYPVAFGTGRGYAMGAMLAGASAVRAIEIACKLDIYSGLPAASALLPHIAQKERQPNGNGVNPNHRNPL